MKNDLIYQITEYDCAPTCFYNALSYLLKREDIPITIYKQIGNFTLDCLDENNIIGNCGTTKEGLSKLAKEINKSNINLTIEILENNKVNLNNIKNTLKNKGSIIILTQIQNVKHYILLTHYDNNFIYAFDPYKLDITYFSKSNIIYQNNKYYNRKIPINYFLKNDNSDLTIGKISDRFALLFNKNE